jgi:hypothetical protein
MNIKIYLVIPILFSIFSIGVNFNKVIAQPIPPIPPIRPIPDPLPLPPPKQPLKPLEDFKNIIPPWYVDIDYNPEMGAVLKIGRECNCQGFRFGLDAGVIGGIDDKTYKVNITGVVLGLTIPIPKNLASFVQNENVVSDTYIAPSVISYVMGSIDDPTTTIFGDLSFEKSPGFNPWETLPFFDLDNEGIYVFQDAQVFSNFLDSSLTCIPEPSFPLSLLALGSLAGGLTRKRKLKPFKSTSRELEKTS